MMGVGWPKYVSFARNEDRLLCDRSSARLHKVSQWYEYYALFLNKFLVRPLAMGPVGLVAAAAVASRSSLPATAEPGVKVTRVGTKDAGGMNSEF